MRNLIKKSTSGICLMLAMGFIIMFSAVNVTRAQKTGKVYTAVEKQPEYPGGLKEFYKCIGQHMHYPPGERSHGRVLVEFVIEEDGSMSDFIIKEEFKKGYGRAAVEAWEQCGKWNPGYENGKAVKTAFTVPIKFS